MTFFMTYFNSRNDGSDKTVASGFQLKIVGICKLGK